MRFSSTARGITALFSTSFVLAFGHGLTFPTIPVLADEFDVSVAWSAQIVTFYAIGRLIGTAPGGIIVDRFGGRVVLIAGPAMITTAALTAAATPFFSLLIGAMLVVGIGDSMWQLGREVTGVSLVNADQRGRLMSGFMGFNSAGMAIGPAVGGVLTDAVNYRAAFLLYAALAFVILVMAAGTKAIPQTTVHPRDAGVPRTRGKLNLLWTVRWAKNIPGLVRQVEPRLRATYLVLVFATFVMMLYRFVWQAFLPVYSSVELDMTPSRIGLLFLIMGIVAFAMIVPSGFVVDKIGRKWATVPSTGIPAIAFLLIPFTDSFAQLAVLMVLMGLSNGLSLGSVATSTFDVAPASARGRLQALRRSVAEVGGIGGPAVGGVIVSFSSPGVPFLVFAPLLIVASVLLGFVAKETLVKKPKSTYARPT